MKNKNEEDLIEERPIEDTSTYFDGEPSIVETNDVGGVETFPFIDEIKEMMLYERKQQ